MPKIHKDCGWTRLDERYKSIRTFINLDREFYMRKMEYVSPGIEVLSLYTDEMMGVPIRPGSTIHGTLDPGDDEPDPEEGHD